MKLYLRDYSDMFQNHPHAYTEARASASYAESVYVLGVYSKFEENFAEYRSFVRKPVTVLIDNISYRGLKETAR